MGAVIALIIVTGISFTCVAVTYMVTRTVERLDENAIVQLERLKEREGK